MDEPTEDERKPYPIVWPPGTHPLWPATVEFAERFMLAFHEEHNLEFDRMAELLIVLAQSPEVRKTAWTAAAKWKDELDGFPSRRLRHRDESELLGTILHWIENNSEDAFDVAHWFLILVVSDANLYANAPLAISHDHLTAQDTPEYLETVTLVERAIAPLLKSFPTKPTQRRQRTEKVIRRAMRALDPDGLHKAYIDKMFRADAG